MSLELDLVSLGLYVFLLLLSVKFDYRLNSINHLK